MKKPLGVFLAGLTALMLLGGCTSGSVEEPNPSVSMMVATDLHYLSPELTDHGELFTEVIGRGDGKVIQYIEEISDAFFAEVVEQQPEVLILSGDLTLNGAVKSHQGLTEKLDAVQQAGVQVLVIPGNHDVDSSTAVAFHGDSASKADALTSEDFFEYYERFGPKQALSRDRESFSYLYQTSSDLRIAMLDTNCYGQGYIKDSTLEWLEGELKKAREEGAPVIAVTHQNLYAHNSLLSFGFQLYNWSDLLALFEAYDVKCNFSGHIHAQSILSDNVTEIVTSALSVAPIQYGSVHYEDGTLEYELQKTDVAGWAAENGSDHEDLLQFETYATEFFKGIARTQVMDSLSGSTLSGQEKKLMAETFADINFAYFSGQSVELSRFEEGLRLWSGQEDGSFFRYIRSMLSPIREERQSVAVTLR